MGFLVISHEGFSLYMDTVDKKTLSLNRPIICMFCRMVLFQIKIHPGLPIFWVSP